MKLYPKHCNSHLLFVLSILFLTMSLSPAQTSAQTSLRALTGFPTTHLYTEGGLGIFKENLNEISGGKMTIEISGPEVIPTNEQFEPIQSGLFDILLTHSAYHLGVNAMGSMMEANAPDPDKRRAAGIIDFVDKEYNKLGVKFLISAPMTKYNIVLRDPIGDKKPSLSGLKIRTANVIAPLVKTLGGAPVALPPGEIYTAMEKGVIDGFTLVAVGMLDYKVHEVAKYVVRPMFGYINISLFMNLTKFKELTAQEQEWVMEASIKSEKDIWAFFQDKHEKEIIELKNLGMKETSLDPKDAEILESTFSGTFWMIGKKKSGEPVEKLHQLAIKNGLAE